MSDRSARPSRLASARRILARFAAAVIMVTLLWWGLGRLSAAERRIVRASTASAAAAEPPSGDTIRILAWNIAHGRGDVEQGLLQNWSGGSRSDRLQRLERIADVLRTVDADVVVLNEVDFDADWSHGLNQAAFLARSAGYPYRVEQRNFDFRLPFVDWAFGNAVLSRFPVADAEWLDLPEHAGWEAFLLGSKDAAVVRLRVGGAALTVVPVHLEFRPGTTRLRAVSVLERLREEESAPVVLAGDFNTAPPTWPRVDSVTAVGELLERGWTSARAERSPVRSELTFPTYRPLESRDWILVEPPLEVVSAEVIEGVGTLSDHAPVVALIRYPGATGAVGAARVGGVHRRSTPDFATAPDAVEHATRPAWSGSDR